MHWHFKNSHKITEPQQQHQKKQQFSPSSNAITSTWVFPVQIYVTIMYCNLIYLITIKNSLKYLGKKSETKTSTYCFLLPHPTPKVCLLVFYDISTRPGVTITTTHILFCVFLPKLKKSIFHFNPHKQQINDFSIRSEKSSLSPS